MTCIANLSDPWKSRMRDKVIPLVSRLQSLVQCLSVRFIRCSS